MAFIIPNAVDTSSGAKFENLDQAEPDSLDFEILGNIGRSGVLSGCEVTSISSSTAVAVSAGTVIVNGSSYSVAANTALALPVAPLGTRFDLVIARVASGTASLRVITGDDDDVNPEYPKSASVIAGSFNSATNIDFNTDVVLAAVYRQGVQSVTTSRIADKRVILSSAIFNKGSDAPVDTASVSEVSDAGSLFFRTTSPSGTSSGVYVKGLYGNWMELARNIGPHFPIGAIAAWPATGALPSGFIEADGQSLLVADYPALFGVYGYTHGGSGNSFNVPDLNGRSLKGTTNQGLVGDTIGSDSVTLTVDNLPEHNHGIGSHTHTLSHTHSIDHSHSGSATTAGGHSHVYQDVQQFKGGSAAGSSSGFGTRSIEYGNTNPAGAHSHTVTVGSPSPTVTSSQSEATTSTPNTGVTDDTGSSQSFSNISASAYVRWIIRAAHGVEADTVGGTSLLDEALEETVTLELVGSGLLPASQTAAASFRMPYGALLTEVRAGLNSGSTAAGDIIIDINESGTSILSTPLTIDTGEASSTTADTAVVISDPDIADDALITVDIDSADTGDSGPLTVTLYFTRDA